MDFLKSLRHAVAFAVVVVLAGGLLAACESKTPRGTLHPTTADKFSYGIPARPRSGEITFAQEAVAYTDAPNGITIERVRPLGLTTSPGVPYLGAVLLKPPKVGFGTDLSKHFPHLGGDIAFVRLPYTMSTSSGALVPALGFGLRARGATKFSGIAVNYRENGHEYTATMAIAVRICATTTPHCAAISMKNVPEASVAAR